MSKINKVFLAPVYRIFYYGYTTPHIKLLQGEFKKYF